LCVSDHPNDADAGLARCKTGFQFEARETYSIRSWLSRFLRIEMGVEILDAAVNTAISIRMSNLDPVWDECSQTLDTQTWGDEG
jgi:hypothetical protein